MRRKYNKDVYMKEVTKSIWHLAEEKDIDGYIGFKYIQEIEHPIKYYCNGNEYIGLDSGYTILEYVPSGRNYTLRAFFDSLNRPVLYYFDIVNQIGIDDYSTWYDDMFLDVTMECPVITNGYYHINLVDELEFKQALKDGDITEEMFNSGLSTALNLMKQLKTQTNDLVNRSVYDLIKIKRELKLIK